MKQLLRETNVYRALFEDARRGVCTHAVLAVFSDEVYLRALLTQCAAAFFGAEEGSREAKLIEEEHFADCVFYPAPEGKLTAETCAAILEESMLRPVEGDRKLFVLDAFQNATPLVQNKLLKLFEEPPEGVYFLVGTTNVHAVLPTVRSRMQTFEVAPFFEESIAAALCRMHGEEGANEAAAACGGIFSVAEKLLEGGGEEFRLAENFVLGDDAERLCRGLTEKDKPVFFAAVRQVLRDALLLSTGREGLCARHSAKEEQIADEVPAGALLAGLSLTETAERRLRFNANISQCALALAIGLKKEREKWQRLS